MFKLLPPYRIDRIVAESELVEENEGIASLVEENEGYFTSGCGFRRCWLPWTRCIRSASYLFAA